jgi:shikimate 5-dehydrogenase
MATATDATGAGSVAAASAAAGGAGGAGMMAEDGVYMKITAKTKFIVSTSGRVSSVKRYTVLLQEILGLDYAYIPINNQENGPIDPAAFAATLKGMNCVGGAISRDIKHTIIPHLDVVDDFAAQIGSVNTVIVKRTEDRRSQLYGYNTDAVGFRVAIDNALRSSGVQVTKAICYGYGGVTSVVVQVLKSLGITTYITGRRLDEAERRAGELGAEVCGPEYLEFLVMIVTLCSCFRSGPVTSKQICLSMLLLLLTSL